MAAQSPTAIEAGLLSLPAAARAGGLLFLAGAAISATLAVIEPTYSNGHPFRVLAMSAVAALIGAVCLVFQQRVPRGLIYAMPALGTLVYCSGMALDRAATIGGELILVWPVVLSAYLLPTWVAWTTFAITVGVYSPIAISILHGPGVTPCVALAATLVITLLMLQSLRDRNARLITVLRSQARTDELTGLLNRRTLMEVLGRESGRASRDGVPLSLMIFDIDLFKQLNDTFGHAAGDRALESLAAVLRSCVRETDTAARIGGEEFAVVLPGCAAVEAAVRADELCRQVEAAAATWPHAITVSVGVATSSAGGLDAGGLGAAGLGAGGFDAGDLMVAADQALYRAKRAGRNCARSAPADSWVSKPG